MKELTPIQKRILDLVAKAEAHRAILTIGTRHGVCICIRLEAERDMVWQHGDGLATWWEWMCNQEGLLPTLVDVESVIDGGYFHRSVM